MSDEAIMLITPIFNTNQTTLFANQKDIQGIFKDIQGYSRIFNTDQITLYANEKDEQDSYLWERH